LGGATIGAGGDPAYATELQARSMTCCSFEWELLRSPQPDYPDATMV